MGAIEDIYEDLDTDEVSLEKFREAVEAKVEQMGGLADEETAAMLLSHELEDQEVNGIDDITPEMEEVKFLGKVTSIGDIREFERDGEDEENGRVLNADVADETGSIRITFWDEAAEGAAEELDVGQVLRIKGRPKSGYNGVEVSADKVEPDDDVEIDVQVKDEYQIGDLSLGISDVTLVAQVLGTEQVRTFSRDDGSEGKVSNLLIGDETGRLRVTLWDDQADLAEEFEHGDVVEIVDGYVREREGSLELHVGDHGDITSVAEDVEYVPDATPIGDLEIDQTVDIAGVIRSADPKRTFDRDDGSEGQVRNIRLQDASGDIRVALWGDKADRDLGPGDEVLFVDADVKDGWQDDLEASAGWQTTVIPLEDGATTENEDDEDQQAASPGLGAFGDGTSDQPTGSTDSAAAADSTVDSESATDGGERIEFTGIVVQAGNPVILDNDTETITVDTDMDVKLGDELEVVGERRDGRVDAEEIKRAGQSQGSSSR